MDNGEEGKNKKINSGIYKIINIQNGKIYVGSAINLNGRKSNHLYLLRLNKHHNKHLQRAFNKYKEENFIFEVLEYVDKIENKEEFKIILLKREQYWIDNLEACNQTKGYNISPTAGNSLGVKASEETKKKQSQKRKGRKHSEESKEKMREKARLRPPFSKERNLKISLATKGKKRNPFTEQQRKNMSIAAKNKPPVTDESRRKMSESQKLKSPPSQETRDKLARFGDKNPMYGRHHKEESKIKMAEAKAKLTKEEVSEIKTLLLKGIPYKEIAIQFNITEANIGYIAREKTWKNVEPKLDYHKKLSKEKVAPKFKQLTKQQVVEIKLLLLSNIKQREIAHIYNISVDVISSIKVGRSWSNIRLEDYINEDGSIKKVI